ncbi:hypothetical protein [Nesterenkonia pannonica]|uniref:hypothetical protein n=1 Tax=Nesterenkonia pannonica TaxID=1548602 RepID=UPI0021640566|nr:hypothetical protein [Nesterenkonia pannonica]
MPAGLAGVAVGTFMVIRAVRTKAGAMLLLSGVLTALSCGLFGVSAGLRPSSGTRHPSSKHAPTARSLTVP